MYKQVLSEGWRRYCFCNSSLTNVQELVETCQKQSVESTVNSQIKNLHVDTRLVETLQKSIVETNKKCCLYKYD